MAEVLPLLGAAALIAVLHMSAPDHWVTLCILSLRSGWSRARLVAIGAATAGGHVVLSILLGLGVVFVGLIVSEKLSGYITLGTGLLMVALGLGFGLRALLSNAGEDYEDEAAQEIRKAKSAGRGPLYFVVLGGALSPDLSILPVFLLAVPAGLGVVADTAVVFATASVLSLVALTLVGSTGLAGTFSRAPAKYNDSLVGFTVAAVGVYVLVFG